MRINLTWCLQGKEAAKLPTIRYIVKLHNKLFLLGFIDIRHLAKWRVNQDGYLGVVARLAKLNFIHIVSLTP